MTPTLHYQTCRLAWEACVAQAKACEATPSAALAWEAAALELHRVLRAFEAHRILPAPKPLPPEPLSGDVPLLATILDGEIEAALTSLDTLEAGLSVAPLPEANNDDCPF